MPSKKYALPEFLIGRVEPIAYLRWLGRKAVAHVKRDRKRDHGQATREAYMMAIHKAVISSAGFDDYTGEPLAWEKISTYDNAASKEGRRTYKKFFGDLPTVDHWGDDLTANTFRICSWRTNDCKNDLNDEELIAFCKIVISHHESKSSNDGKEPELRQED